MMGFRELRDRADGTERWLALATVLVLAALYEWIVLRGAGLPGQAGDAYGLDFRDTVWFPLRVLVAGGDPWNLSVYMSEHPWVQNFPLYAPMYWPFMLPFLALPYRVALALWTLLAVAGLVGLVWMTLRLVTPVALRQRPWLLPLVSLLVLFTRPGRAGLWSANWAVFCALGSVMVLLGCRGRVGVIGGTLALVKPQVGLPLLPMLVLRGEWRTAWQTCWLAALLSLPGLALAAHRAGGPSGLLSDIGATLALGDGKGNGPGTTGSTRVDVLGTIGHAHILPPQWLSIVLLVLTAVVTWGGYVLAARRFGVVHPLALVMGGLGCILVLPNQIYSAPVLLPAIVAMVAELWRCSARNGTWVAHAVLLMLLLVPFANTGPVFSWLGMGVVLANLVTGCSLALAAVLALALLVMPQMPTPTPGLAAETSR